MWLNFIFCSVIIISSIISIIFKKLYNRGKIHFSTYDNWTSWILLTRVLFGIIITVSMLVLFVCVMDNREFKINYKSTSSFIKSNREIENPLERVAIYKDIIKINNEINKHKIWANNPFIGIYYDKEIAEFEYLK